MDQASQSSQEHHSQPDHPPEHSAQSGQADSQDSLPEHPELNEVPQLKDEVADAIEAVEKGTAEDEHKRPAEKREHQDKPEQKAEREAEEEDKPETRVKPSALAQFHRQQKELFHREQNIKAKEAEYARIAQVLENAKSDRLAALELMGYSDPKEFIESIAQDGGRESPERKQIRELKKWKEQQEKLHQEQQQRWQQQQHQQQIQGKLDEIKKQVQSAIKSDAYQGSLVDLEGTDDIIMQQMDRMATETGTMPRIEDAIKAVEGTFRRTLDKLLANPEAKRYFEEKLRPTKLSSSGTPQSKTRAKTTTIGADVRTPGTRIKSAEAPSEDQVFNEALSFLKSRNG